MALANEEDTRSLMAEPPEERARARLTATWPGGSASVSLPERGRVVVGRSNECDLTVGGRAVSREHAALHVSEDGIELEDLKSSNGTRVGGSAVASGARIPFPSTTWAQLGDAVLVLFGADDGPVDEDVSVPFERTTPMATVLRLAGLVARGSLGIVIQGETGAGKEVLAQYVHEQSPRAQAPFVRLNCAALPESMAESELFGHERGSFTGAHASRGGLLEAAHEGTLFLDEVGELSLAIQAKLLRALGNGEVLRVGASTPRRVDVRIITASHRRLGDLVQSGEFREDLFYRLNGMTLEVPPLRQRREEILPLAEQFLREESARLASSHPKTDANQQDTHCSSAKNGQKSEVDRPRPNGAGDEVAISRRELAIPTPKLHSSTRDALLAHRWPGNIRELKTCIQRALLLSEGRDIVPEHCSLDPPTGRTEVESGGALDDDIKELQKRRIQQALEEAGGNQTQAARLLGMSRRALIRRLDEFGFPRPRKDGATSKKAAGQQEGPE